MTACRWVASTQPRAVIGRHDDHCADDACRGCQPCTEPHCRVCSRTHHDGTCAECLAATRADLHEIARLCDALPAEVEHRGLEGEAMVLLGPAADPEARGHLEASVACGRVPADYLDHADGELHPLFVLGTHDMVWREALDHDEPETLVLADTVDYLDRTMSYMAGFPHVPFEDFARDLRRCVAHLEAVLHDGEQRDRGAPCPKCGAKMEHRYGRRIVDDRWVCPRVACDEVYTELGYRGYVEGEHRKNATHLTDRDMEIRTGIKAGTVRVWANRHGVERRTDSGRVVYSVADVERVAKDRDQAS